MEYNRETRKWDHLNEKYDTQMSAWLNMKESGSVYNENYKFPEFPSQEDLDLNTYVDRLKT